MRRFYPSGLLLKVGRHLDHCIGFHELCNVFA